MGVIAVDANLACTTRWSTMKPDTTQREKLEATAFVTLRKLLVQQRNRRFVIGVLLIIAGVTWILRLEDLTNMATAVLAGIAMIIVSVGAAAMGNAIVNFDVQREELLRVLEREPDRVVWFYYVKLDMMPFGVKVFERCTMHVRLSAGEGLRVFGSKQDILKTMDQLSEILPHATMGYSLESEQLYRASPNLLRK